MSDYQRRRVLGSTEMLRARRTAMPYSEQQLWERLRGHRLQGFKFRRKHGIGCYVVDFYCHAAAVAVEIGPSEAEGKSSQWPATARSRAQDEFLRSLGVEVLRFSERDVQDDLEGLIMRVAERVRRRIVEKRPVQ
jgi:adenine-specific DNA-methyltransferase